jgi:Zn-finger nucleic acid-binding protein
MKCTSCEIEINPQWKHAVEINVCPFCGKHIMEEHLKNLFVSLRETMDSLASYQDQLNDWMLSNHNYIKTDSPNIGMYMPKDLVKELKKAQDEQDFLARKQSIVKVKTETGEEDVLVEKIQSEEKTNEFFKRAEVIKSPAPAQGAPVANASFQSPAEKTQHFKKVVQQIKKAGTTAINQDGAADMISPEMMENADPEAVAEFESLLSGNEIASSLPTTDDDEIPSVVLAMANKGKGNSASSAADLLKLQQMQERVRSSKENFESGVNRGKGGFSRSG